MYINYHPYYDTILSGQLPTGYQFISPFLKLLQMGKNVGNASANISLTKIDAKHFIENVTRLQTCPVLMF